MNRIFLYLVLLLSFDASAVVVVTGNSTASDLTFTTTIQLAQFHRPSQTYYVGLADGGGNYALAKAHQVGDNQVPDFVAIGSNTNITNNFIDNLALSTDSTNPTQPYIAFTVETNSSATPTTFSVVNYAGNNYATTIGLEDANSATAGNILKLVAAPNHIIAAVRANGQTSNNLGVTSGDGLALTRFTRGTTPTFTYYNAGDGTTATPTAAGIDAVAANAIYGITNTVQASATTFYDMIYNDDLKRVYVSSKITGPGTNANDSAFGVAIFKLDPDNNTLTKLGQCANPAAVIDLDVRIVGFKGSGHVVALRKLAVMKTSTGFYYLIVNGGASTDVNTANEVYAVALVSGNGNDTDGTFAKNDSAALLTADFTTQASAIDHLATTTHAHALVGGGVLPIPNNTADLTGADQDYVSFMETVGDTVYCTVVAGTTDSSTSGGIYYSQALFNNVGKIVRWTDWAKAAPFGVGDTSADGSAIFSAVDATDGSIWAVTTDAQAVQKTEWTQTGSGSTSLVAQLNSWFPNGCYSVCDINQSTQNIGNATTGRYALFGGPAGKVVFTKISTGASTAYLAPQTDVTDFTATTAYLETSIDDSSPVIALGTTKSNAGSSNYFLAGTKNGLYAWALTATGAGFTGSDFAAMGTAPFITSTYSWQQITSISGQVQKIVSTANQIYVLTRSTSRTTGTITDKVYRIAVDTTVSALIANTVLLATSGTGSGTASDLSTATLFFDIAALIGAANGSDDKLLLATNDGIYQSTVAIENKTTQTGAAWTQISNPATDGIIYDLLTVPQNSRLVTTAWSSEWADDANGNLTYTRSSWRQLGSADAATTITDQPNAQFCSNGSITSVVPTKAFWSDGARRFFVGIPNSSDGLHNNLYVQPYDISSTQWNSSSEQGPLTDAALASQDRFYWVQAIGATGALFAGGNKGVVSLE